MTTTRILIAEDHGLVLAGLRMLIERIPGAEIVGTAADGREALELLTTLQPDVALLDVAMPYLSGLEVLARATSHALKTKIIIVTAHANEEYVLRALKSGAAGYLLKDETPAALATAIATVMRGETYLSPNVSASAIASYVAGFGEGDSLIDTLSARQREVLQFVAEGKNSKEIARLLTLSVKTVETHRAQLMARLQIFDIPGLVRFAIRNGVVSAEF